MGGSLRHTYHHETGVATRPRSPSTQYIYIGIATVCQVGYVARLAQCIHNRHRVDQGELTAILRHANDPLRTE
jgi:hypothetical protein